MVKAECVLLSAGWMCPEEYLRWFRHQHTTPHLASPVPQQPTADLIPPGDLGNACTRLLGLGHDPKLLFSVQRRRRSTPVMISILLAALILAALIQAPFRSKARSRRQGGLRPVDTKKLTIDLINDKRTPNPPIVSTAL